MSQHITILERTSPIIVLKTGPPIAKAVIEAIPRRDPLIEAIPRRNLFVVPKGRRPPIRRRGVMRQVAHGFGADVPSDDDIDDEDEDMPPRDPVPIVPMIAPNNIKDIDGLPHMQREEIFWNIISKFQWKNQSNGAISERTVTKVLSELSHQQRLVFKVVYANHIVALLARLQMDKMFDRNDVNTESDQIKIVSHVIAMGKDTYMTLSDDLEFLQYLIIDKECQSLNALLPKDLKY